MTISRCSALRLQPRVHELDGQPVEQLGVAGRLALQAEVLAGRDDPGPEVGLPDPVDDRPRRGRRPAVDQPSGEVEPSRGRAGGHRVEERRDPRLDRPGRLEEVAALEDARGSAPRPFREDQLRRPLGMLGPQAVDPLIRFLPGRDRGPPVAEDDRFLGRRPLVARHGQDIAHRPRQRVGDGVRPCW